MKHETFSPAEIEQARSVDLVSLIGRSVALKKEGPEYIGLCPFHAEATPSFTVVPKKGFYHCFGCGAHGDAIGWLQQTEKLSFPDAVRRLLGKDFAPCERTFRPVESLTREENETDQKRKIARAKEIWGESVPASGTLVEKYLVSRGLSGVMIPPTLRFHPRLWCQEAAARLPAMLGLVMAQNAIVAVHRTYLRADGSGKAQLEKAKKILGPYRGGHCQLDAAFGATLVVAEGIETALSVKKACPWLSVWAALSLNNMGAPVPKSVRNLILCADGDNKDPRAAEAHLARAVAAHRMEGRVIRIARPEVGKDFNDMLRGSA